MNKDVMELIDDILDSSNVFEHYIEDVHQRRTLMREWKEREKWFLDAIGKLNEELCSAQNDGDVEIVEELQMVSEACQARYDQHLMQKPSSLSIFTRFAPEPVSLNGHDRDTLLEPIPVQEPEISPVVEMETEETDPEKDAEWIERSNDLSLKWEALKGSVVLDDNMELDRDVLLEIKAIRCSLNALAGEIIPYEAEVNLASVSYDMSYALQRINISEEGFPFDCISLSSDQWSEFATRYRMLIPAWVAMDWYEGHNDLLEQNMKVDLLNSIAATQRLLYRKLSEIDQFDPIQESLFNLVNKYNDSAGFLPALQENTLEKNLLLKEASLDKFLDKGMIQYDENFASNERKAKKEAAIHAVLKWEEAREGCSVTESSEEKDREELCALLDACIEAKVPPSDSKVREAMLYVAPVLLKGLEPYTKYLEAVTKERARRNLNEKVEKEPDEPVQENTDEDLERMCQRILPHVEGRNILMIGGRARRNVCDDIMKLTNCKCDWKGSERGDNSRKFEADLHRADIILIIKNLISHRVAERAREIATEKNHSYVMLPSGHGLKAIINQLDRHFTPREA